MIGTAVQTGSCALWMMSGLYAVEWEGWCGDCSSFAGSGCVWPGDTSHTARLLLWWWEHPLSPPRWHSQHPDAMDIGALPATGHGQHPNAGHSGAPATTGHSQHPDAGNGYWGCSCHWPWSAPKCWPWKSHLLQVIHCCLWMMLV